MTPTETATLIADARRLAGLGGSSGREVRITDTMTELADALEQAQAEVIRYREALESEDTTGLVQELHDKSFVHSSSDPLYERAAVTISQLTVRIAELEREVAEMRVVLQLCESTPDVCPVCKSRWEGPKGGPRRLQHERYCRLFRVLGGGFEEPAPIPAAERCGTCNGRGFVCQVACWYSGPPGPCDFEHCGAKRRPCPDCSAPLPTAAKCATCGGLGKLCPDGWHEGHECNSIPCPDCTPATPPREDDADTSDWSVPPMPVKDQIAAARLEGRVMGLRWAASVPVGLEHGVRISKEIDRLEREQKKGA